MINPGPPTQNSRCEALKHRKLHKIEFDFEDQGKNQFVETDLNKVVNEINSFITPDKVIFSLTLKHVRQDLGCIKWLNANTGHRMRPIDVYSLEDLYVTLVRSHWQDEGSHEFIGQGLARLRMEHSSNPYDTRLQCAYHQARAKLDDDGECCYCAKALSVGWTNVLIDDVNSYADEGRLVLN